MTTAPRGSILMVDDDENVLLLAQWILGRLGYRMVGADTAEAGIDLYRRAMESGERFAAVILDLWIPGGMPGERAISVLRELDPAVAAFVMSGNPDDPRMRDSARYGFRGAISKTCLHESLPAALQGHFGSETLPHG
jgi:DNA-binding NtrC family response regulator